MAEQFHEPAPGVSAEQAVRTAAGTPVTARLLLTNRAPEPRVLAVTTLGVDPSWLPGQSRSRPVLPGASVVVELTLHPAVGTVPARYPMTVAVQALDPVRNRATAPTALAELVLVVDAPGQIAVELQPSAVTAVFGRTVHAVLRNTGAVPAAVRLEVQAPASARVSFGEDVVEVAPGATVRVRGRARVARPRALGQRERHTFTVSARGDGAPRHAEGSLTSRAILGSGGAKFVALLAVVALWVTLAAVAIPKLADRARTKQAAPRTVTSAAAGTAPAQPSATPSGGSGSGSGGAGSAGSGGGASNSAAAGSRVRLNGTVAGDAPSGVTVSLRPTSLVDEQAQAANPVGIAPSVLHARGLVAPSALALSATGTVAPQRSTVTTGDGTWAFPGISAPGYYLLTFAKPGFQTQRYVIDAAQTDATQPLKVTLSPGQGSLSGTVNGPSGAVGGAKVTLTDGTNTITTSSNSKGQVGSWSVGGLSTPGSYLVTVSKDGLGTESQLVTLGAGGNAAVPLTLRAGVASLVGSVTGFNGSGVMIGLGGVQVSATDGTITRTATTVTKGPVGSYTLPDLPVPGSYTVTVTASGYLPQTQRVTLGSGQSKATVSAVLTTASAVVTGRVTGDRLDQDGKPTGATEAKVGAGLILRSPQNTYKITSTSNGSFRFDGVLPGTYVLTAESFLLNTAFATVVAVAGRTATVTTFDLHVQTVTNAAQIVGFVGGATNPSNTIICPIAKPGCVVSFRLLDSARQVVPITPGSVPASGSGPTRYTLTASSPDGLAPGLYRLVISAEGYLAATVSVQVPLNAVATAPQVNLYPANTITGTVNALGLLAGSGTPPPYTNCVYAIPIGSNLTIPSTCDPTALVSTCTTDGAAGPAYAQIDATSGKYTLDSLCDGSYLLYVVVTNPDYQKPANPAAVETVSHGQTVDFSLRVSRLGRIVLTVSQADQDTGGITPVADATALVVNCSSNTGSSISRSLPTVDNILTITGLTAATWNCAVTSAADPNLTASVTGIGVGLDQDSPAAVTLARRVAAFVGRATTSWTGTTQAVAGAQVTVSGVTGYQNGQPITASTTVITDGLGCFAITPNGALPAVLPGACATDTAIPRATLPLVVAKATFSVAPNFLYRASTIENQTITSGALVAIAISPQPVPFSGTLQIDPPDPTVQLSQASIQVTKAAPGTGQISVAADDTGALTWTDSAIADPTRRIQPGSYTLVASLAGYAPATVSFTCGLLITCVLPTFALEKLAGLTISTVDAASAAAVGDVVMTLRTGSTTISTQSPVPGSNSVTFTGLTPGSSYVVHIQAAGYAFGDAGDPNAAVVIPLDCGATITITPGGSTACVARLTRLGAIAGTTMGVLGSPSKSGSAPMQPLGGVTLSARHCSGTQPSATAACTGSGGVATLDGPTFSVVSATNGAFRITGTTGSQGLISGWWQISASASGYSPDPAAPVQYVQITDTSVDTAADVPLYANPVQLGLLVTDNTGAAVLSGLSFSVADASGNKLAAPTAPASSCTTNCYWDFGNVVPTTYQVTVTGARISVLNTQVSLTVGTSPQVFPIQVMLSSGSISGSVSAIQGADTGVTPLGGVTVSLGTVSGSTFTVAKATDGKTDLTAVSADGSGGNPAGYLSLSGIPISSTPYVIRATGPTGSGYYLPTSPATTVTVSAAQSIVPVSLVLSKVTHDVSVTVKTVPTSTSLAGQPVSLTPTVAAANPTYSGYTLSGTAGSFSTTASAVRSGDYTLSITLPPGHPGTPAPASGSPALTCVSGVCTATLTVPGDPADLTSGVSVSYTLTEYAAALSVTATALPTDSNKPTSVDLTITDSSSTVVYTNPSFPVGASAVTVYLIGTGTYTAKATADQTTFPGWPVASKAISASGAVTLPLTEVGATVKVDVTQAGKTLTAAADVTLTAPSGSGITWPTTAVKTVKNGSTWTATFTNVPFATGWQATATISASSNSATFDVTSTTPAAVPIDVP